MTLDDLRTSDRCAEFDSVYFLTFGGWKTELQSNRLALRIAVGA